jgi:predicted RNA binding protein with dsRBD fold (UPF0201 family)
MAEEKKVVAAYVVKHFDNGDISVEDAGLEGTTKMADEEIYKDVEEVAETIRLKRIENAARAGAYGGVYQFYSDLEKRAAAAAEEAAKAAPAGPTLEKK